MTKLFIRSNMRLKIFLFLLSATVLAGFLLSPSAYCANEKTLTIVYTTDTEGNVDPCPH